MHFELYCISGISIRMVIIITLFYHSIDRTLKVYIGGAQRRPDAQYARPVIAPSGDVIGQVAEGNRKDIREAVEAAHKAAPGLVTMATCSCYGFLLVGVKELHTIELR